MIEQAASNIHLLILEEASELNDIDWDNYHVGTHLFVKNASVEVLSFDMPSLYPGEGMYSEMISGMTLGCFKLEGGWVFV